MTMLSSQPPAPHVSVTKPPLHAQPGGPRLCAESTRSINQLSGKIFAHQLSLPRLPVPPLLQTLSKYAQSLEPLLSPDDLSKSKRIISEFARSRQADELQSRLEARAADPECANWLEEWWDELSYMACRQPVIPYVSYHYSFNNDPGCTRANQRAAKLVCGALDFRRMLVNGVLEPDMAKTGPLCSHSYNHMFNACRIPARPSDHCRLSSYARESIVVIRSNRFFSFTFAHSDGSLLCADEIEGVLDRIVAAAATKDDSGNGSNNVVLPVGILTADNRDSWADTRQELMRLSEENAWVLDEIEASAFVVSLEPGAPESAEEFSRAVWHGDGRNRWFDKPCQFVVFDNARAGFNGEHSMMDGTPTCRLVEYVMEYSELQEQQKQQQPKIHKVTDIIPFHELKFTTSPAIIKAVERAEALFNSGVAQQHLYVLNFVAYGKEQIKQLGCSPDAYIQMVIQLAYTRLHGIARPTYESSMTRQFLHGRTETCRSVTTESTSWCRSMDTEACPRQERIRLFRLALDRHTRLTREAVEGLGVDRHLLGLRMCLHADEEMPALFEDSAYAYSSHWFLSTSQISSEKFASYGWSEVTPRGYGIAYNIRRLCLVIHITCIRNEHGLDSEKLAGHFETAAMDVRDMMLSEGSLK
ncbi:acyltransferase ChoActase/COT/CPT [Kickxella alabastrina]|uniref:acyltransferase ChoActase/COT/CPT n=1 Tax=Kickxella alabastrina TaxID=61397 RepID=UPI00221FBDFF|nr:acyltransferase ChoActase/COT/CPT [Kickxella alabastrina]KAI7834942.1 acyltransferase ChoActase/COT/CPT [Kickxella alabastrina]KAJ1947894.1 Carnitine O-acetyltransferase mitochondrial [Kickxella alabastrina]